MKLYLLFTSIVLIGCTNKVPPNSVPVCLETMNWSSNKKVNTHVLYKPSEKERDDIFIQIDDWPSSSAECWYKKNDGSIEVFAEQFYDRVSYEFINKKDGWVLKQKHNFIILAH